MNMSVPAQSTEPPKLNVKSQSKSNLSCETIVLNTREAKRALEFQIETVRWWNYFVVFN